MLSRAITLIESKRPEDQALAAQLLDSILPHTGNSLRIGITGVPGVGKSTFIESIGSKITEKHQLAVLSIDPTSSLNKGSILGDKTRMQNLSLNPKAYIRPSPSGKSLGGVAQKTRETILLCEAAGYDVIIVETVGVGQSETAVNNMVDFFLLLMLAGGGDELQGIKRGIMEMADALVINKADGQNIKAAKMAKKAYQNALHLFPPHGANWTVPVTTSSAIENNGTDHIWDLIKEFQNKSLSSGYLKHNRVNQNLKWMNDMIMERLEQEFFNNPMNSAKISELREQVKTGELSVRHAVDQIFN